MITTTWRRKRDVLRQERWLVKERDQLTVTATTMQDIPQERKLNNETTTSFDGVIRLLIWLLDSYTVAEPTWRQNTLLALQHLTLGTWSTHYQAFVPTTCTCSIYHKLECHNLLSSMELLLATSSASTATTLHNSWLLRYSQIKRSP